MFSNSAIRFGKDIDKLEISDIEKLIDNKVEESNNLEYKEPSQNLKKDCDNLARIISGFLNQSGGVLIYGVTEEKREDHCYPNQLKWVNVPKERLENTLLSRVQPWCEHVRIRRISNKENKRKGIFVFDVPKSNNPPHMHDHRYYQRLNFQTIPMPHESVKRIFQANWFSKRQLRSKIVEPLYSEIKINCEKLKKFEMSVDSEYSQIVMIDRYLYDQINPQLRQKINDFYSILKRLNLMFGWVGQSIATRVINEGLCEERMPWLKSHRDNIRENKDRDYLKVRVDVKDLSGRRRQIGDVIWMALILKKSIMEFLKFRHPDHEVIGYTPFVELVGERVDLTDFMFTSFWSRCEERIIENPKWVAFWNERSKVLTLGTELLEEMLQGSV